MNTPLVARHPYQNPHDYVQFIAECSGDYAREIVRAVHSNHRANFDDLCSCAGIPREQFEVMWQTVKDHRYQP